jgi:hypothetical protein
MLRAIGHRSGKMGNCKGGVLGAVPWRSHGLLWVGNYFNGWARWAR